MMPQLSSQRVRLLLPSVVLLLAMVTVVRGQLKTPRDGNNILAIPYDGAESHFLVAKSISKELVKRGHKVTFLLHEKHKEKFLKYQDAYLFSYEYFNQGVTYNRHDEFYLNMTKAGTAPFKSGRVFMEWLANLTYSEYYSTIVNQCNQILLDTEVMTRLKAHNFDLILVDSITLCRLPQYLLKPVAAFSALPLSSSYALYDRGLLTSDASYYSSFLESLDQSLSFFYRLRCTLFVMRDYLQQWYDEDSYLNIQFRFISKYAQTNRVHKFNDADIHLISSHYVLDYQRSLMPNAFEVGGLTTRPKQPLSQEWEDFLNDAEFGILLTYVQSIDDETKAFFVKVATLINRKFPGARVIWQLKGTPPAGLLPNVKVAEWVPQNDLLGHPKMRLFVSHGGINSIFEAIYHAVPMILMPVFGDQHFNALKVVNRGIGEMVAKNNLHGIEENLLKMLRPRQNIRTHQSKIDLLSTIFRESPPPTEIAADWIEYAMRNRDTLSLKPVSDWGLLQYLPRDVIVPMTVLFIMSFIISVLGGWVFFRVRFRIWRTTKGNIKKGV